MRLIGRYFLTSWGMGIVRSSRGVDLRVRRCVEMAAAHSASPTPGRSLSSPWASLIACSVFIGVGSNRVGLISANFPFRNSAATFWLCIFGGRSLGLGGLILTWLRRIDAGHDELTKRRLAAFMLGRVRVGDGGEDFGHAFDVPPPVAKVLLDHQTLPAGRLEHEHAVQHFSQVVSSKRPRQCSTVAGQRSTHLPVCGSLLCLVAV